MNNISLYQIKYGGGTKMEDLFFPTRLMWISNERFQQIYCYEIYEVIKMVNWTKSFEKNTMISMVAQRIRKVEWGKRCEVVRNPIGTRFSSSSQPPWERYQMKVCSEYNIINYVTLIDIKYVLLRTKITIFFFTSTSVSNEVFDKQNSIR